jgi:hypothetical protein
MNESSKPPGASPPTSSEQGDDAATSSARTAGARETRAQRRRRRKAEANATPSAPTRSLEPAELAKRLAIGISFAFQRALQASTVTVMTKWAFYQNKALFRTNPANTLAHSSLVALEERATVDVYEWLNNVGSTFGVSAELRAQWAELRNHRDHASHRLHESEWDRPAMREFAREARFIQLKTVQIWKATTWIRDQLRPEDRHWLPSNVLLDYGMAMMIDTIYRTSMTAEAIPRIPPVATIYAQLGPATEKYLRDLDAHARQLLNGSEPPAT